MKAYYLVYILVGFVLLGMPIAASLSHAML